MVFKSTAKRSISVLALSLFFASACEQDGDLVIDSCDEIANFATLTEQELLFFDLAFNQEFGEGSERLRKWNTPIRIFVEGITSQEAMDELNVVVTELNALSTAIPIEIVGEMAASNLRFFFGTKEDYVRLVEPAAAGIAEGNSGFATIAWNNNNEIFRASACVDIFVADEQELKHIIREELAQTLGLINDTVLDENSIFHQFIGDAIAYSNVDTEIIALMLGDALRPGMCQTEVIDVIQ